MSPPCRHAATTDIGASPWAAPWSWFARRPWPPASPAAGPSALRSQDFRPWPPGFQGESVKEVKGCRRPRGASKLPVPPERAW